MNPYLPFYLEAKYKVTLIFLHSIIHTDLKEYILNSIVIKWVDKQILTIKINPNHAPLFHK